MYHMLLKVSHLGRVLTHRSREFSTYFSGNFRSLSIQVAKNLKIKESFSLSLLETFQFGLEMSILGALQQF